MIRDEEPTPLHQHHKTEVYRSFEEGNEPMRRQSAPD